MIDYIREYLTKEDCIERSGGNNFKCEECYYKEECASIARQRCDSEYAESVDYGGYNSEEEFWEQIYD